MSKLKITEVQVDCRNLSQEQISKIVSLFKKNNVPKCPTIKRGIEVDENSFYLRVYNANCKEVTFLWEDNNFTTITYDEFIKLFDKPKFKPKKAIKELEQRITLLEQKLSEKDTENSVNEAVKELPIVIEKGMRFRHHITGGIYEIEGISVEKIYVYTSDKQNAIEYEFNDVMNYFNKGHWIALPPTEKKESELTKGAICKFWNDNEDSFEIGRYDANPNEDEDTYIHVNILTLESFKNAKVISVDEALQLFKKQLLNEN